MVNPEIIGKTYPVTEPYLVGREKIKEFALATFHSSDSPSVSLEASKKAGFSDLVAPPTFAIVLQQQSLEMVIDDPEADLDFSRVVHGDQGFSYERPIIAGDELTSQLSVESVKELAGNQMIAFLTKIFDTKGDVVAEARSTLVVRGG
ncbi:MAG: MaoC family dehydratase N-terminal domain-containing protein [Microbacteriaceae bacterium]|nr:MaoC family dehydratase N-terminal domain-containing protein [Microbacteriaceae bacterium]MDR9443997.1 MaoC family dehydratase N-terminal domain-containing protein [Microbacteriaceae bacterium]